MTTHSVTQRILCPICRAQNRPDARFCQQCGNDVLLDNTYRITRVIKEGGMGVVYQAVDEDGAFYAVKEMHDRFTNAEERQEGIERFLDEARLLRRLRGHPNIPRVYRSFIDEGRYYLAMEFIFGEDLDDLLKRQKRFPEPQVLRWADQLCDVLEYLHANGLIYRDMKPSNVMITHDGNVKVVDFGIAKLLQPGQRGTMIGTPGYSPPEQYQGIATPQSDVYALAATLHHLLTGRDPREEPPFSFPPAHTIRPDISIETSRALEKALAMELDERFQTVSQFRRALPIPTGERRPTQPFDLEPRRVSEPRPRPAQARPEPLPAPRRAQPRQQRRRQRRAASSFRRLVATALIAGGLWYGAVAYGPQLISTLEQYIPAQAEPASGNQAPATNLVVQRFEPTLRISMPQDATNDAILLKFQEEYFKAARQEYPGAQPGPDQPLPVGGWQVVTAGGGTQELRATMSGSINVPQP